MEEDLEETREINQLFSKIPEKEKIKSTSFTLGSIICILTKHLINSLGYATAARVISRDIRELGRKDIQRIKKLFNLNDGWKEKKRLTRMAGMLLGLEFKFMKDEKGETHALILKCPFSPIVEQVNRPFICKICEEYNRGAVEELFGKKFTLISVKRMTEGDEYCKYHVKERNKD